MHGGCGHAQGQHGDRCHGSRRFNRWTPRYTRVTHDPRQPLLSVECIDSTVWRLLLLSPHVPSTPPARMMSEEMSVELEAANATRARNMIGELDQTSSEP